MNPADQPRRTRIPSRGAPDLGTLLQRSILLSAALATVLFALPLAWAVRGLYQVQAFAELARDAERVKAVVVDQRGVAPTGGLDIQIILPTAGEEHVRVGIYDAAGVRVRGAGPVRGGGLLRSVASSGVEASGVESGELVVAVPFFADRDTAAGEVPRGAGRFVVRVAEPQSSLQAKTYLTWLAMVGLAGLVLAVVAAVGRARARRLARPLKELAAAADALGQGDFSVRATRAGVSEIDHVSGNLERTARRLGAMLERERAFTAEASHQLRTPLTAMRLSLESALITPGSDLGAAVDDALTSLDRLEQTVLDLLLLARDTSSAGHLVDVAEVIDAVLPPWRRPLADQGRRIVATVPAGTMVARISGPALRTVLDVLVGNALTHGGGTVRIDVRSGNEAVVVEVSDEGAGITGDPSRVFARRARDARGTGIGLALARSLVEADGARLELIRAVPPTFGILLPLADELGDQPADRSDRTGPAGRTGQSGATAPVAELPAPGPRAAPTGLFTGAALLPESLPEPGDAARSGGSNR